METVTDFILRVGEAPKSLQMVTTTMKLNDACSLKKSYHKSSQNINKQRHYFANKDPSSQSYGFSSSHVSMWELDYKESWVLKNWCFWTVVLEKTLESPLDCKEIKSIHPKWNQFWILTGKTDAEAEVPILWLSDVKNQKRPWFNPFPTMTFGKDPDVGKDWRWEEKGTTENDMIEWHHWFDGHEFEQAPGVDRTGKPGVCSHGITNSWTRLSN